MCESRIQRSTVMKDTPNKALAIKSYFGDGPLYQVHSMQTPLFPWRPVVIPQHPPHLQTLL